jgi:hypothetical protein
LEGEDLFRAVGNDAADKFAKAATKIHPQPSVQMAESVKNLKVCLETVLQIMAAVLPLWPFGGAAHKRAAVEKSGEDVGAPLKLKTEDLHGDNQGDHWRCRVCRGFTATNILPKARKRQRCKGLRDRLAKDAEQSLGHQLVEFCTPQGPFTICSLCGFYGARKSVGLSTACDGIPSTRSSKEQWNRVFVKGKHPRTNVPLGLNLVIRSATFVKQCNTRSFVERKIRKLRLTRKAKPWVAASSGILDGPSAEDNVQDNMELCEEPAPDDDTENSFDAEEEDEFVDVFGGNVDMSGNDQQTGDPPPAPAPHATYLDLEKDLEAT